MSTSTADVVVTGLGATTPLGGDVASTWEALLAGRSGVSRITDDWIKDYPAQLVARLATDPPSRSTASGPAGSTAASRSRSSPPRRPGATPAPATPASTRCASPSSSAPASAAR